MSCQCDKILFPNGPSNCLAMRGRQAVFTGICAARLSHVQLGSSREMWLWNLIKEEVWKRSNLHKLRVQKSNRNWKQSPTSKIARPSQECVLSLYKVVVLRLLRIQRSPQDVSPSNGADITFDVVVQWRSAKLMWRVDLVGMVDHRNDGDFYFHRPG